MLKIFVNNSDQSAHLSDGSLVIQDQIQNKANTASFSFNKGVTAPSENQSIKVFDCVKIVSLVSTALEVRDVLRSGLSILTFNKYRAGEYLWLGIGTATEERVTIASVAASTTAGQVLITLSAAAVSAHSANELAGKKVFAGTLTYVNARNPRQLTDVVYDCTATDFTKIFDRKLINDSWTSYDARQILNDALDTTVNYNKELDDMEYANSTAAQAEWIESGDGGNPTIDTTNFIQGANSVSFPWTNSGGTATFSATPTSADFSDLTGAASGAPTKGNISFWYKRAAATGITSLAVRAGSDATNYAAVSFTPEADTDWHFISLPLTAASITGTPVWTALDYLAIVVTETATTSILIDDVRLTADGSFTMYNFEATDTFDNARAAFKKPTVFIDALAKSLEYSWFIDYDKDIHFFDRETNVAPFGLSGTTDNFWDLKIDVDTSQLKNRQTVRGGTKTSDSLYKQAVQGDGATREWIMKSQFKNLTVYLDDNSSTDTCEAGTTTTNITAALHGLVSGDWIVNRTRSQARQITFVDVNNFTVGAVASQTTGDTFSKFATSKTVGIEFLDDETTVDYVYNFAEKSIRASSVTVTLPTTSYLLFSYNEIIPIRIQLSEPASIAAMKAVIGGDGIFDGAVISDSSLDSTQGAQDRARAELNQYANAIVKVSFETDSEGLSAGQLVNVVDTGRSISDNYLIQRIRTKYNGDFPSFSVDCASSLFGIIEYFQKLSQGVGERQIDEDEIIDQIFGEDVEITISEAHVLVPNHEVEETATVTVTPSDTVTERDMTTDPFVWEPDASVNQFNLAQWG